MIITEKLPSAPHHYPYTYGARCKCGWMDYAPDEPALLEMIKSHELMHENEKTEITTAEASHFNTRFATIEAQIKKLDSLNERALGSVIDLERIVKQQAIIMQGLIEKVNDSDRLRRDQVVAIGREVDFIRKQQEAVFLEVVELRKLYGKGSS